MRQLILVSLLLVLPHVAHATPPKDVLLEFDHEESSVIIKARHVSKDLKDHFIRKIVIQVAGQAEEVHRYKRQKKPTTLERTFPVKADPGDNIYIELYCQKGGSYKEILVVPQPPKEEAEEAAEEVVEEAEEKDVDSVDSEEEEVESPTKSTEKKYEEIGD